jgi:hypothetical protein
MLEAMGVAYEARIVSAHRTPARLVEYATGAKARGLKVTLYPFAMMDIAAGNTLTDPWTGLNGQKAYPWRGRVTGPDGEVAAAQVAAMFGTTRGWGLRRFALHYAALAAETGADGLLIGSEMRGLTMMRDAGGGCPAVAGFRALAAECRAVVGPDVARQYRLNVGTIVEAPMVTLVLNRRRKLGEVEEWFVQGLEIGDTFMFGGQLLRFEGMRETVVDVVAVRDGEPKVPVYEGGRLPLTTELAARVRALLADPGRWDTLPAAVRDWLRVQRAVSVLPRRDGLLVEIFPRGGKFFLVAYCFEGRYAHQTLGMLLTRRMERAISANCSTSRSARAARARSSACARTGWPTARASRQ